jgi:hypothetical protein
VLQALGEAIDSGSGLCTRVMFRACLVWFQSKTLRKSRPKFAKRSNSRVANSMEFFEAGVQILEYLFFCSKISKKKEKQPRHEWHWLRELSTHEQSCFTKNFEVELL